MWPQVRAQPWERCGNLWGVAGPLDKTIAAAAKQEVSGGRHWSAWPSIWWMEGVCQEWGFRPGICRARGWEKVFNQYSRSKENLTNVTWQTRMFHSNLDIAQCQECCPACREDLLKSDPVRPKLVFGRLPSGSHGVRDPEGSFEVSPAPRQGSHMDCLEERWREPFPQEFHDYFFLPECTESSRRSPETCHMQSAVQNTLFSQLSLSILQWICHCPFAHKDWQAAVLLSEQRFESDKTLAYMV